MRRRMPAMLLVALFWLTSMGAVSAAPAPKPSVLAVSPFLVEWLQAQPSEESGGGQPQPVTITIQATEPGLVQVRLPQLFSLSGSALPVNRIGWDNGSDSLAPFSPEWATAFTVPGPGNFSFTLNLGLRITSDDQIGVYLGFPAVQFLGSTSGNAVSRQFMLLLDIAAWVRLSYTPEPVAVSSPTGLPGDDLLGQAEIQVESNSGWTLEICAPSDFRSINAGFGPDQVYYRCGTSGAWTQLSSDWTTVASGNGPAELTFYLKVVEPFNKRAGHYLSTLKLRATTP